MRTKFPFKTMILASFLMLAASTTFAQCDKMITLTASTTNRLNDKGVIEKTKEEETIVKIDKKEVNITTDGGHELTGGVKTYTCNWSTPFKTGKTVVTGLITDGGRDMNATITIVGKDGKISLTFEAVEMPGKKIQLLADKFE